MDIVSKLPTRIVTDLVFNFLGGEKFTVTVGPEDIIEDNKNSICISHIVDGKQVEGIVIQIRNLLFHSQTTREVTVYPAGQSPYELALAEMKSHTTTTS